MFIFTKLISFLIEIKHFKGTEQSQPLLMLYSITGRIWPHHLFPFEAKGKAPAYFQDRCNSGLEQLPIDACR